MLAQAGDEKKIDEMIKSGNWQFERKYDGERCVIQVKDVKTALAEKSRCVDLFNRTEKTINTQFPELVEMAEHLPSGIYDGEIYVPSNEANKDKPTTSGRTSVNATDAKLLARVKPATYMCFDVLEYEGENIENKSYEERKEILARVDSLRVLHFQGVFPIGVGCQQSPDEREAEIKSAWAEIVATGNEGMVAKRVGSRYSHTRSPNWVKLKTKIERVLSFNQYEVNTAGALITDGFHRVQVGGVEKAQKVIDWINIHGSANCEIVGMAVTETGKIRQPVFKRMVGDYE